MADPPRVRTGNFPFGGNSSLYPTFFIASQENFVNAEFILPETARARSTFSGGFVFHWRSLPSSIDPQPVPVFHAQMTSIQHDTSATSVPPQPQPPAQPNFTHWHLFTISLLALGDFGYYFCRSDLSVVMPLLIRELGTHGIPANAAQVRLRSIASTGVLAYALGEFVCGRWPIFSAVAITSSAEWQERFCLRCSSQSVAAFPSSLLPGLETASSNRQDGSAW